MQKNKLGNSDIYITDIGFGAWAIGGGGWEFGWGPQNDDESVKAILKTLEMGINWIDTAAVYGLGHSEKVVAKALKEWNDEKPYVFTKCSLKWDENGNVFRHHKPELIKQECEDSLRRLQKDVIDLYQVHWPPFRKNEEIDAAWEMMKQLKDEGKVKWIAVSNFNVSQMQRAEAIAPITSLQPPYSMIHRDIEDEILPYCIKKDIGVIVYSPMLSGLLTGKMTRERINNFPADDWRRKSKDFIEPALTKNLAVADKLTEIGKRYNRNAGEVAIAWTLKHPAVTGAIVGARNAKQVSEVMNAGTLQLSEDDIAEIETALIT